MIEIANSLESQDHLIHWETYSMEMFNLFF